MRGALLLLALFLLAFLAGCYPIGGTREAQRYFVLDAPAARAAAANPQRAAALAVERTSAASFYDTQDIVYSRSPGTRAYYQFNAWTERPSRRIHELLRERLEAGGAGANLVLRTHLEEIYHDAARPPGVARIVLSAELFDKSRQAIVARRTFSRAAPAASYDAPGAVRGFSAALDALLDDVVAWARQTAAPV